MIRTALESDVSAIVEIYNHYIKSSVVTFELEEISTQDMLERMNNIHSQGHCWLVSESEGIITGYAYSMKWAERAAYINTAEVSVYIAQTNVGKGLGTKLYQSLFQYLKVNNIHVVIGGITLPNKASVALHEKFEMEQVAHFKEVGFKFSKWLDVGYWQVKLNK